VALKAIALILAVFTFSLSMFPCDDELMVSTVGETTMVNSEHNGHEHEEGTDFCSPFCVCAVINVVEIETEVVELLDGKEIESPMFVYLAPFSKAINNTVFQPPQA